MHLKVDHMHIAVMLGGQTTSCKISDIAVKLGGQSISCKISHRAVKLEDRQLRVRFLICNNNFKLSNYKFRAQELAESSCLHISIRDVSIISAVVC